MFITNDEKENIRISIRTLQTEMAALIKEVNDLKAAKQKPEHKVIFTTAEAPWGYKKDGGPRKRPGRKPLVMKVGNP
jgi:hypothetical protein